MIRKLLIGIVLFAVFAIVFAPASLVRTLLEPVRGVDLVSPSGSLWDGRGTLLVDQKALGELRWSFLPMALLSAEVAFDYTISGSGMQLGGRAGADFNVNVVTANGQVDAAAINAWLRPYDMVLDTGVTLENVRVGFSRHALHAAEGEVRWPGGGVSYRLSGRLWQNTLPPLVAYLSEKDGRAAANVFEAGGQTPLLSADTLDDGFVRIGITKLLTRLLGNPWPGNDPDHTVVVSVEEQLF